MAVLRPEHAPATLTGIDAAGAAGGGGGRRRLRAAVLEGDRRLVSPRVHRPGAGRRAPRLARRGGRELRFGSPAAGDVGTLARRAEQRDFAVEGIALDGGPPVWSSTYVRTCLGEGDVAGAAEALGRPLLRRRACRGGGDRGREPATPTANVPPGGFRSR